MKSLLPYMLLSVCLPCVAQPHVPTQLTVASFNMAWAGTVDDYRSHQQVCRAVKWCDTRPPGKNPTQAAIAAAKQCELATEQAAGGKAAALQIAPCNAYKTKGQPEKDSVENYRIKLEQLRGTVERLIEQEGVHVIAFQEVKSKAVVQQVLGKFAADFETCDAPHSGFQTVAFAWDKRLAATRAECRANQSLAVKEHPDDPDPPRKVRPGLALTFTLSGEPLTFMNVHLKSACASVNPGDGFPPRVLTDRDSACRVLNRQVSPLEDWLEDVHSKSKRLVLLGDFNRKINDEAKKGIQLNEVRSDGSDPAGPNRTDDRGYVKTRYLWQEIADGSPALVLLDEAIGATGCRGFEGLDHMVMSQELFARQAAGAPRARKVGVNRVKGQKINTSDHCPTVLTFSY